MATPVPPTGANGNPGFLMPHSTAPIADRSGYLTIPWQAFLRNLVWAVPQVGAAPIPTSGGATGDVIQDGTVTVGNVAVWTQDHHIGDGGPTSAVTTPSIFLLMGG